MVNSSEQSAIQQVTARDINVGNITQIINNRDPQFYDLDIKTITTISSRIELSEKFIEDFQKRIREENLLILGGIGEVDKAYLARYLAGKLAQADNSHIREWIRSPDTQTIDIALTTEKTSMVYVLTEISPQNVGYNLSRIKEAAKKRRHFVIITTDTPKREWLGNEIKDIWLDLDKPEQEIYDSQKLNNFLIEQLQEINLEESTIESAKGFGYEKGFKDPFNTPDKIVSFVRLIDKQIKENPQLNLDSKFFNEQIDSLNNTKKALERWFNYVLDNRGKLIALALNFFDGLSDEQFFAALDRLFEENWNKREPSLANLDYGDLDEFSNFFNFNLDSVTGERKIESRFPQQRLFLFEAAWEKDRRKIFSVMNTVVALIRDSADEKAPALDEELFGRIDDKKSERLRRVLSEALSDIGFISDTSVGKTLLTLAADPKIEVQSVAAEAIARWRAPNYERLEKEQRDEKLFTHIDNWRSNESVIKQLSGFLDKRKEELKELIDLVENNVKEIISKSADILSKSTDLEKSKHVSKHIELFAEPRDYIQATVALTVSYAAVYDRPNELNNGLCNLIEELSEEKGLVRKRFFEDTLPRILSLHLHQLGIETRVLFNMLRDVKRAPLLSRVFGRIYKINPQGILKILELWEKEYPSDDSSIPGIRENRLIATALTYGEIEYESNNENLSIYQAIVRLNNILTQSDSNSVQEAVLKSVDNLVKQVEKIDDFKRIDIQLQKIFIQTNSGQNNKARKILTSFRERFCKHFIHQLEPSKICDNDVRVFLRDITLENHLISTIGKWLASAYEVVPEMVLDTLQNNSWYPDRQPISETINETWLRATAIAYGKIQYDRQVYKFGVDEAFSYLQAIIETESRNSVRETAFEAIEELVKQVRELDEFQVIDVKLQEVLTKAISKNEQKITRKILTNFRERFCKHFIHQLEPSKICDNDVRVFLRDITLENHLISTIGKWLASAYKVVPEMVLDTLQNNSWYPDRQPISETINETWLRATAIAYGKIQYDREVYKFGVDEAFSYLQAIIETESRNSVRETAFEAIEELVKQVRELDEFQVIDVKLQEVLTKAISKDEQKITRKILTSFRERFCNSVLPGIDPSKIVDLRYLLRDMTLETDLISNISEWLANAYKIAPENVLNILQDDSWYSERDQFATSEDYQVIIQDNWQRTIAQTYHKTEDSQMIQNLASLLDRTEAISIREEVLTYIIELFDIDTFKSEDDNIYKYLKQLVSKTRSTQELDKIVESLSEIYLKLGEDNE